MSPALALASLLGQAVPSPPVAATSAPAEPPHLRAARAPGPIHLDGKLDEPAWRAAPETDAFTQRFPEEGRPPSERTTVRVLYDDYAVYVGIDCEQRRSPIVTRLTRRDRFVEADWAMVDIGSRGDHVSSFYFQVNAAGVLQDGIRFNDSDVSQDWDENWDARTTVTDHGWSVEFEIPLRILRFDALAEQSWDFQIHRGISERQEIDQWSFVPRGAGGVVSHFGRLDGLDRLRPGRRLELRPFGLLRLRHSDATPGLRTRGWDLQPSVGVDAKWHVAQDVTLDLAVHPDFGQVEADQVILNLTTFETFFPEKRPFFLEGIDLFSTQLKALYTRRIGRQPDLPALAGGETLVDAPEPSPIWGAAKLVGNLGNRFSLGLLSALTGRNDVVVQKADGSHESRLADPATAFNVVRLRRELGRNARIGLLATATNRFDPGGGPRATNDAYVGGLDGYWRSPTGTWLLAGQALATRLQSGPARAQPDGIPIEPGRQAPVAQLFAGKQSGRFLFAVQTDLDGRQAEYNDLGFQQRKNDAQISAEIAWQTLAPWWRTLESRTQVEIIHQRTLDDILLKNLYQLNERWRLANFWTVFVEGHFRGAHFDDREAGDGTALERAGLWGLEAEVATDPRRRFVASVFAQAQRLSNGSVLLLESDFTLRLHPQLDLGIAPSVSATDGEPRFVEQTGPSEYRFGRLRARSVSAILRSTFTFTPRLTLQGYAQVFLASGRFSEFTRADTGGAFRSKVHLANLSPIAPGDAPGNRYDFESAALNVNLLLRWEYRLGSVAYLVYTRAQSPTGALDPGAVPQLDIARLRGAPSVDAVMLKLSYWWG